MGKIVVKEYGHDRLLAIVVLSCLLGLAVVIGWIGAIALVVVGLLVWLGYQLASQKLSYDRKRVEQQRQALDAEWRALEQTGRVRSVFFNARRAMQEEARRSAWPTADPDDQGGQ